MGVTGEICRKTAALSEAQADILDAVGEVSEFAADIAQAQVTVFAKARRDNFLVVVAQANPNTTFVQQKHNVLGRMAHMSEEPLVWRTMGTGERITGQREWALGMEALEMRTFPIRDSQGKIIAAVSFESSPDETASGNINLPVETAYMFLNSTYLPDKGAYRPLSARDGIIIVDQRGQIIFTNPAAGSLYKMWGQGRIIGRRAYERQLHLRIALDAAAARQLRQGELDNSGMVLEQRAVPIIQDGQTIRTIVIVTDVTDLKKKEKELLIKSAVIQEIHHRVKNNLQTIASLLRLQARRTDSPAVKAALRESVNRILSISVVHEFLSQHDEEVIDIAEVARNILDLVIQNMLEPGFNLKTVFNGENVVLPSERATSLALVINELIQNSIEHGFVGRKDGIIGVNILSNQTGYQIDIYDNGVGLPDGFNLSELGSLGLQIVKTLIETDLGGKLRLYSSQGTHAHITIPRIIR